MRRFYIPTFCYSPVSSCCLQACHADYVKDCHATFGSLFGHDDSINDRAPGLQLENGFQRTARLYAQEFGRPYTFAGGMWRGPVPPAPSHMAPIPIRLLSSPSAPSDASSAAACDLATHKAAVLQDATNSPQVGVASASADPSSRGHMQILSQSQQKSTTESKSRHFRCDQDGNRDEKGAHRKKGFLQRIGGMLWTSRAKKNAKDRVQKLPRQLPVAFCPLDHVMHVAPAAARDHCGNALGHQDSQPILPCYEADRPPHGTAVLHVAWKDNVRPMGCSQAICQAVGACDRCSLSLATSQWQTVCQGAELKLKTVGLRSLCWSVLEACFGATLSFASEAECPFELPWVEIKCLSCVRSCLTQLISSSQPPWKVV